NTVTMASWLNPSAGAGPRAWHGPLYAGSAGQPTGATVILRIPKSVFGSPVTDHKIWMASAACTFAGNGPVNCASQGNWPTAGDVVEVSTNTYSAPALTDWALVHLTGATACPVQP